LDEAHPSFLGRLGLDEGRGRAREEGGRVERGDGGDCGL